MIGKRIKVSRLESPEYVRYTLFRRVGSDTIYREFHIAKAWTRKRRAIEIRFQRRKHLERAVEAAVKDYGDARYFRL